MCIYPLIFDSMQIFKISPAIFFHNAEKRRYDSLTVLKRVSAVLCRFEYSLSCNLLLPLLVVLNCKHLFLCRLRSIAAHKDLFVRRLSVRLFVCVCLSGSHTFLVVTHSYVWQATHAFLGMLPLCNNTYHNPKETIENIC